MKEENRRGEEKSDRSFVGGGGEKKKKKKGKGKTVRVAHFLSVKENFEGTSCGQHAPGERKKREKKKTCPLYLFSSRREGHSLALPMSAKGAMK